MIVQCANPAEAEAWCGTVRGRGKTLGFVPTMGALHEGHLELVARAKRENNVTCASVYVNPLQFNDPRDFERYPRDFAGDAQLLEKQGVDMVFTGTLAEFFPGAVGADGELDKARLRDPGPAGEGLEGAHRPGHFAGVVTIVERLFACVQPTRAYFGQKDYQQTLVVRDLARELARTQAVTRMVAPQIVICPTSRETNGLARSSRNALLSEDELKLAVSLSRGLLAARDAWLEGERDAERVRRVLRMALQRPGIEVEYAALRDPERWSAEDPKGRLTRAIALVAAKIGGVRLIDNMYLSKPAAGS